MEKKTTIRGGFLTKGGFVKYATFLISSKGQLT